MLSMLVLLYCLVNTQGNIIDVHESSGIQVEYVLLDGANSCNRTCSKGAPSMVCKYHFEIETYHSLSKACYDCPFETADCFRKDCVPGDGSKRGIVTVNRKLPGPSIEVCKGDLVVVDVVNKMGSETTTIHWHGQQQKDTPYMDGVPYVTQCPILPHSTFRYTFKALHAGTHFWHSHVGMQRADGAYGPLIVKVPREEDPHSPLYDYDLPAHVMVIIDWDKQMSMETFLSHHHNDADNKPPTLLINGLGRYTNFSGDDNRTVFMPAARFHVEQGHRYRFRVINAGFLNCPIEMSVDNHSVTVISSDGDDVKPLEATSLVTYAGERFDFILDADQPRGLYWIRFKGLMDCDERFTRAFQTAVLEYDGGNFTTTDYPDGDVNYDNAHRDGLQVNALNRGVESNQSFVSMPHLEALEGWDDSLTATPDFKYFIAYDFYKLDNEEFHRRPHYGFFNVTRTNVQLLTPQFNHISMQMPAISLLSQRNEIPEDMFCNRETLSDTDCINNHCQCPHGLKIKLHSVVELIFVDEGFAYDANHPIHLHGYNFRVIAMERMGSNVTLEEVRKRDELGLIRRNLLTPPLKDTVTVPDGGYTIVRFKASNPGYWILHCHLEFHAEIGMAMVLQVGDKEEMLPVPPDFPRCGNYVPEAFEGGANESRQSGGGVRRVDSGLVVSLALVVFLVGFSRGA